MVMAAVILVALPDSDGSSGPSDDIDKLLEGDGDVAVVATLPDADRPGGPSDTTDKTEGGDGGANLTGLEWDGTTGPPLLEIPLVLDPPGFVDKDDPQLDDNDPQSDLRLQEMTAIKPDELPSAPDKEWVFEFNFDMKGEVNAGLLDTDTVTSMALVGRPSRCASRSIPKAPRWRNTSWDQKSRNAILALRSPWETSSCATYGKPRDCKGRSCSWQTTPIIGFAWRKGDRWNSYRGGLAFTLMGAGRVCGGPG
jgi:hypothetical protein